jgi:hypothetical protein
MAGVIPGLLCGWLFHGPAKNETDSEDVISRVAAAIAGGIAGAIAVVPVAAVLAFVRGINALGHS